MFKNIIKKLKSRKGNSLLSSLCYNHYDVTLEISQHPKFLLVSVRNIKEKKTLINIDKIWYPSLTIII